MASTNSFVDVDSLEGAGMIDGPSVQSVNRLELLLRAVVLLASLAAILIASYTVASASRMLPLQPGWVVWCLPILVSVSAGLILMLVWASRKPGVRGWTIDGIAVALGVSSATLGISGVILIAFGISVQLMDARMTATTLAYRMTAPWMLVDLLKYAALPAVPGAIGLKVTQRRVREAGRVSMSGVAYRFSLVGVGVAVLVTSLVGFAALYRWMTWGS